MENGKLLVRKGSFDNAVFQYFSVGSENKIHFAEGGDFSAIAKLSTLQEIVECPVCKSVPISPIFNCATGHIICSKCRPQLERCCLCNANYTRSRNFVLEQIVDSSQIVCEYKDTGCLKVLKGKNYAIHVKACEFGPIECFQGELDNCNSTLVDFASYKEHLIMVHNIEEQEHQNGLFSCDYEWNAVRKDTVWTSGYLNLDGKTFVTREFIRADSVHLIVVLVGTDEDAKQYKVRMTFSPPESDMIHYDVTVPVRTIRCTDEEMTSKYLHAHLSKDMLASFCEVKEIPDSRKCYYSWKVTYIISRSVSSSCSIVG